MAKKCPNCGELDITLGKCISEECSSGYVGIIFCDKCYNDHLITAHVRFVKIE